MSKSKKPDWRTLPRKSPAFLQSEHFSFKVTPAEAKDIRANIEEYKQATGKTAREFIVERLTATSPQFCVK